MELATWVPVTVVALVLFHLLLWDYLSERRSANAASAGCETGDGDTDTREDAVEQRPTSPDSQARQDADIVRCRECGAKNEREYRYCHHCVAELPGTTLVRQGGTGPIGGMG